MTHRNALWPLRYDPEKNFVVGKGDPEQDYEILIFGLEGSIFDKAFIHVKVFFPEDL